MSKYYLAVTIGPIIDTLDLATYPAALWYASSMFSYLAGQLCETFQRDLDAEIISPYYAKTPEERHQDEDGFFTEGAGLFHDRIICTVETENINALQEQIDECVKNVKTIMRKNIYLQKEGDKAEGYLNIHYLLVPAEQVQGNCILALSNYLDGLELCPTFRTEAQDEPLLEIFKREKDKKTGEEKDSNKIKSSPMLDAVRPNVLTEQNGNLRSIEHICGYKKNPEWKRQSYFAVVQADGDSMSEILKKKTANQDVMEFSQSCLKYAAEAAKTVRAFGAMPIYAGGDDLLFLAPMINEKGKSVFSLCKDLSDLYKEKLNEDAENPQTTLSFGISIQYYKFPLYEALNRARKLLFDQAKKFHLKKDKKPSKNCMAIQLEKHSGQSFALLVCMDHVAALDEILLPKMTEKEDDLLQSIPYHLAQGEQFFKILDEQADLPEERYLTFLRNYLSRSEDDPQDGYLQQIANYYRNEIVSRHCQSLLKAEEKGGYEPLCALIHVLRLKSFLIEKGGEED